MSPGPNGGGRRTSRPDPLTSEQRRLNMSRIRSKDTKPELVVRKGLHARGLRYRLHDRNLPGTPDLVFPSRRAVLFIHGCFWHGHDCPLYKAPSTNADFWEKKVRANQQRDILHNAELGLRGWRVLSIWECAVRGSGRRPFPELVDDIQAWFAADATEGEIGGCWPNDAAKNADGRAAGANRGDA